MLEVDKKQVPQKSFLWKEELILSIKSWGTEKKLQKPVT